MGNPARPETEPGPSKEIDIGRSVKWTYYYLYVLLDICSRYVVGWLLARQESGAVVANVRINSQGGYKIVLINESDL